MLQLKRRLSERAIHSTSSGFLLKADDQEIYLDNLESFKIDVLGIFLTLFSTSLMIACYFHEDEISNYRNGFVGICIMLISSQLALMYIMPKLYLTYLEQFTLGEGILISHCIILFYYSNMMKITGYFSSTLSMSVFVIAKMVLLFLPMIFYMVKMPRLLSLTEKTPSLFEVSILTSSIIMAFLGSL